MASTPQAPSRVVRFAATDRLTPQVAARADLVEVDAMAGEDGAELSGDTLRYADRCGLEWLFRRQVIGRAGYAAGLAIARDYRLAGNKMRLAQGGLATLLNTGVRVDGALADGRGSNVALVAEGRLRQLWSQLSSTQRRVIWMVVVEGETIEAAGGALFDHAAARVRRWRAGRAALIGGLAIAAAMYGLSALDSD
jgi:hypothetical protein